MESEKAKQLLQRQIEQSNFPAAVTISSQEFQKWARDTEVTVERIFGKSGRHLEDLQDISFSAGAYYSGMPPDARERAFQRGLEQARGILRSMVDEIAEYGLESSEQEKPDSLAVVTELCTRFHLVARQLRERHAKRSTLEVEDEYDVQDLLHAVLRLHFDDIRKEDPAPNHAGASSRVDFLLKREKIVVEAKKTRKGLGAKEVGDELLIDIQRYQSHPDCKTLVCFVYDPEGRIPNPRGLEDDLSGDKSGINVRVIIAPKGA